MRPNAPSGHSINLGSLGDSDLLQLRAVLHGELKRRGLALSVGQVAEKLAIDYFNANPTCPNPRVAAVGTANVDALSHRGDRYSIKGVLDARKTGTVYPTTEDPDRQFFEYLLIVKLNSACSLQAIYEFEWRTFVQCRSWDKRMNGWYVGFAARTLTQAKCYLPGGDLGASGGAG